MIGDPVVDVVGGSGGVVLEIGLVDGGAEIALQGMQEGGIDGEAGLGPEGVGEGEGIVLGFGGIGAGG